MTAHAAEPAAPAPAAAPAPEQAATLIVRVDGRRTRAVTRPWARVVLDGGERVEVPCLDDGTDPFDSHVGDRLYVCRLTLATGGEGRVWVTDGPATGGRIVHVGKVRLRDGAVSNLRVLAKVVEEDGRKASESPAATATEALGPFDPRFGEEVAAPLDGRPLADRDELAVGRWPTGWRIAFFTVGVAVLGLVLARRRRPALEVPAEPAPTAFPAVAGLPGFAGGVGLVAGAMPADEALAALRAAGVEARGFDRRAADAEVAAFLASRPGPVAAVVDGVPDGFWGERAEARLARLAEACAPALAGRAAGLVLLAPLAPERVLRPDAIGARLRPDVTWVWDGALHAPPKGPAGIGDFLLARPGPAGWAAAARWGGPVAALATAALAMFGGALLAAGALFSAGDGVLLLGARTGATPGSLWSNAWALDALAAGEPARLLSSDAIYWPTGAELVPIFGNVVVPALAAPFQALLGYPGYWNAWVLAAIVGNALAAFLFARRAGASPAGASVAGLAFAFCPPLLAEIAAGRQLQFVAFPLPLALAAGMVALDARRPRDGWLAGLALAFACASYWFWGAFAAAVLGACWAQRRLRDPGLAEPMARVARMLAPVSLLAVPLCVAANRGDMPELTWGRTPAELAATPGGDLALSTLLRHGVDPDALLLGEDGASRVVHVVTLLLVAGGLAARRTRLWAVVAVLAGVFALGPYLPPGEGPRDDAWLPLPAVAAYAVVPFVSRLLHPDRALVVGALAVAVVAAFALDALARRLPRAGPLAARGAALAAVLLLPAGAGLAPLPRFSFALPDHYRQLGLDGAVAELPIGFREEALLWQPLHGRPLLGGPGELAAMEGRGRLRRAMERDTVVAWLAQAGAPLFGVPDLTALHAAGLRYVLVNSKQIDALSQGRDAKGNALLDIAKRVDVVLGPALFRSPDVIVYRVPATLSVEDLADRMLDGQSPK